MAISKEESSPGSGYRHIYRDLLRELGHADISAAAERLALPVNRTGEVEVPFIGRTYLISRDGVRLADDRAPSEVLQSVLIRYLLHASPRHPAGQFVTLAELAGPLFNQGGYSAGALERPIIRCFQGRVAGLLSVAASAGGRPQGEGGSGSISLVFDLLPHILLQLIFYDRDDEFPARATLLYDRNAAQVIDFETLAVAVTLFVRFLTGIK
jgi:hypothetical protein